MGGSAVLKTYQEINEKIRSGKAVVVTAEEMVGIVREKGDEAAAREIIPDPGAPLLMGVDVSRGERDYNVFAFR